MTPPSASRSAAAAVAAVVVVAVATMLVAPPLVAQDSPPVGRDAALNLEYPALSFEPPRARLEHVGGDVPVLFLEDHRLPLVSVFARFKGGYGLFPRERYAAATALPALLRNGGTVALPPDSVDLRLESLAVSTSFGSGGESMFASMNVLTSVLDEAVTLWSDILQRPRFDSAQVEVWRGRELESVLRRLDDPRRLAFSEFNRLMYGDHPTGWEMEASDLDPEDLRPELLRAIHREVFCLDNLVLGVTGDIGWDEARGKLEELVAGWPPCPRPLPEPPLPEIRREPGVYLIPRDLNQSTVVMAHATEVRRGDTGEYFASRIGNAILGNSGFSSRLLSRVRTEAGYAYSASSLWTTPRRAPGLVGAITQTRSETTVAAIRLILETIGQMTQEPPSAEEVALAVDQTVNGFVFNFENPSQVVSRQMLYLAQELPRDWLQQYVDGIQAVEPEDVGDVFARHVDPGDMIILVVGKPEEFDAPLEALGNVRIWEVPGASER
jgi:zinc protease